MKTIEETYPDQADECFSAPSDYSPMLQSFGYEILLQVDDSDYQGDSRLIFRNGDKYGLLIFGWGSCSGCDALQACESIKEIEELRDSIHKDIKWDSLQGLHDYISNKHWELDYSWSANETKEFVEKSKELLGNLLAHNEVSSPNIVVSTKTNTMTHTELVAALAKPGQEIIAGLTPETANLTHMAMGVAGEAGELLDAVKKHVIYGKPLDIENVIEELGDIEFFLEGIRQQLGVSREECLASNIEKLQRRYPQGRYADRDAITRADKNEP